MRLKVGLLGGGSWGTTVAATVSRNAPITLWARDAEMVDGINRDQENRKYLPGIRLPAALRRKSIDGFVVEGGRIGVADDQDFAKEPLKLLAIFRTALENGLDFHPATLRLISHYARRVSALRRDPAANAAFMRMTRVSSLAPFLSAGSSWRMMLSARAISFSAPPSNNRSAWRWTRPRAR